MSERRRTSDATPGKLCGYRGIRTGGSETSWLSVESQRRRAPMDARNTSIQRHRGQGTNECRRVSDAYSNGQERAPSVDEAGERRWMRP
jgi:hypothetical protein